VVQLVHDVRPLESLRALRCPEGSADVNVTPPSGVCTWYAR